MPTPSCPRCGGRFQDGFLLDLKHHNDSGQTSWVEGAPVKSWLGTLKIKGRTRLPVKTLRCERCGFLESYALPDH